MKRRVTITVLIAIIVGIAAVSYFNRHQGNSSATPALPTDPPEPSEPSEDSIKTWVHVYYANSTIDYLVAEKRSITVSDNPVAKGKAIIGLLIRGPKGKLVKTLPASTTLRDFYLTPKGVAVVDFTKALTIDHPGVSMI